MLLVLLQYTDKGKKTKSKHTKKPYVSQTLHTIRKKYSI